MLKGIILAGGKGTRLHPLTKTTSKQLLPVYNKPMIFYPFQTLLDLGVEEILIIGPDERITNTYNELFGNGDRYDISVKYKVQESPGGIAEAFIIGEEFIGDDNVALILGDNIFVDCAFPCVEPNSIFVTAVADPSAYGVAVRNDNGTLNKVVEKPSEFISSEAVVGLYIFDNRASEIAKTLKSSSRGELEIADMINKYKELGDIWIEELDGYWFDAGDFDDLLDCANLIRAIETRTKKIVGLNE
jgi:glucose-1-phosphate thymidylyltransferase